MTDHNTNELAAVKAAELAPMSIKDTVLAQFKEAETGLIALADRYRNVAFDVKTPKGMKEAIAARADLRDNGRLMLTRSETRVKGEVNDLKRVMADEVARLVGLVKPVEDAIDQQIKAEEQRKAAEKAERERIEAERVAGHRANIDKLKNYVERAKGQPIESIERAIEVLAGVVIGPEYEEFQAEATAALVNTVDSLTAMVADERERIAKEAEAARVAAELEAAKAEIEALRKQQAEARAAEEKRQEEAARLEREQREAQELARREAEAAEQAAQAVQQAAAAPVAVQAAPVVTRPAPVVAAQVTSSATIKLGEINARLAPIQISAAGLAELGFEPEGKEKSAVLYREADFPLICQALIQRLTNLCQRAAA